MTQISRSTIEILFSILFRPLGGVVGSHPHINSPIFCFVNAQSSVFIDANIPQLLLNMCTFDRSIRIILGYLFHAAKQHTRVIYKFP